MKKYFIGGLAAVVVIIGVIAAVNRGHEQAAPSRNNLKTYVALGDSVVAGVGLNEDSDSSACNRTNQSYPNKVSAKLNYTFKNIACSGATLPEGILGAQNVNQLAVTPQLKQLFALPKPSLISITVGANDVQWTSVIAKCYTSECGTPEDAARVASNLAAVSANLRTALAQIQTHYGQNAPRVIVTGYHQVFPTGNVANCSDLKGIDASELSWGRQLQTSISDTLRDATMGYSFVTFVPVDYTGHELCTADSWVQGLNDKQPYHPTEAGQAAFASAIIHSVQTHQ